MLALQTIYHIVTCQLHLFLKCHLDYPWLPTHMNMNSTLMVNESPVLEDWPGAFQVDCVPLAEHEDIKVDGFSGRCSVHGGS
jgi:hypothetical protein